MDQTDDMVLSTMQRIGCLRQSTASKGLSDVAAGVALFQRAFGLPISSVVDDATRERLVAFADSDECVVVGRVVDQRGPVVEAVVAAVDRDLGDPTSWTRWTSQPSDTDGWFVVRYRSEEAAAGDARSDDGRPVVDMIVDLSGIPRRVQSSAIRRVVPDVVVTDDERELGFEAKRVEWLEVSVVAELPRWVPGDSEFEKVEGAFRTIWPDRSPAGLSEDRREPEFVARELDVPVAQIELLVDAHRLAEGPFDGTIRPEVFYALSRSARGLRTMMQLATAGPEVLRQCVLQGVEQVVVPETVLEQLNDAVDRIVRVAPRRALDEGGDQSIRAVLAAAVPDDDAKLLLLSLAAEHADDPAAYWAALGQAAAFAEPGRLDKARLALQLDAVTRRHLPLMNALQNELHTTTARDLLDVSRESLQELLARPDIGVPAAFDAANASPQSYADYFLGQVKLAFPTETVARIVATAPSATLGGETVQSAVQSFLERATRPAAGTAAFHIGTTNVDSFVEQHGDTLLDGVAADSRPTVVSTVKQLQRVFKISAGPGSFSWLLENGFSSAAQVARVPQETFVRSAAAAIGEDIALQVHGRALTTANAALLTFVQLNDAVNGFHPAALLGGQTAAEVKAEMQQLVQQHLPSWDALFGQGSWCGCDDCGSVFSPAAYLVDLFHFLDRRTGPSPLGELFARRPDLQHLQLSCENTNTLIPYVDLINEVLEGQVVNGHPAERLFDSAGVTSEMQLAAPLHTEWAAYVTPAGAGQTARLDRAVYPTSLPFDASLVSARSSLTHLGVDLADLMQAVQGGPMSNRLAAERLGVSPNMFAVITGVDLEGNPSDLTLSFEARFGFDVQPAPDPIAELTNVASLLKRWGISLDELIALLDMRFANPGRHLVATLQRLGVTSDQIASYVQAGLGTPSGSLASTLQAAGVAPGDFATWAQSTLSAASWQATTSTVMLDPPLELECDPAKVSVRHWDPQSPTLGQPEWVALDRLVRLWKACRWTIEDLDLALSAVGATELSPPVLRGLAQIVALADRSGADIATVVTLFSDLDPGRTVGFYARRFASVVGGGRVDSTFTPDWKGEVLSGAVVEDHLPAIQAAVRASAADLQAVRSFVGPTLADGAPLTLQTLSLLTRHVLLARLARLNVRDLVALLPIAGATPFVPPTDEWRLTAFLAEVDALASSGVKVPSVVQLTADLSTSAPSQSHQDLVANLSSKLAGASADASSIVQEALAPLGVHPSVLHQLLEGRIDGVGRPAMPSSTTNEPLMRDFVALAGPTPPDAATTAHAVEAVRLLSLAGQLLDACRLQPGDITAVATFVSLRQVTHQLLTFADLLSVIAYSQVRARTGQSDGVVPTLWSATSDAQAAAILATLVGCKNDTALDLMSALGHDYHALREPRVLRSTIAVGDVLSKIGCTPTQLVALAAASIDHATADALRDLVRVRYDESAWLEVSASLQSSLRECRRDALVAFLLPRLNEPSADHLYRRVLLDVETNAVVQTSRIKQAISSTQLFVQMVLMRLVPEVKAAEIDAHQWKWMEHYRVWEANRRVLLYPENYALPGLRTTKTPLFKALESSLLQDDVSDASTERAIRDYLDGLDRIAKLDIIAIHEQTDFEPDERLETIVHLLGRTTNTPKAHYYRQHIIDRHGHPTWTPWTVMPADVEGDLVTMVVFNRRLYLFWAIVTTSAKTPADDGAPSPSDYYQEIQLAWSEYRDGTWSAKRLSDSKHKLRADFDPRGGAYRDVHGWLRSDVVECLQAVVRNQVLEIRCVLQRDFGYVGGTAKSLWEVAYDFRDPSFDKKFRGRPINDAHTAVIGRFQVDDCHGALTVHQGAPSYPAQATGAVLTTAEGGLQVQLLVAGPDSKPRLGVLDNSTGEWACDEVWIHNDDFYFAFNDVSRTYLGRLEARPAAPDFTTLASVDLSVPRFSLPAAAGPGQADMETVQSSFDRAALVTDNPWASSAIALAASQTPGAQAPAGLAVPDDVRFAQALGAYGTKFDRDFSNFQVTFQSLWHPFACAYIKRLEQYGVEGFYAGPMQSLSSPQSFADRYAPRAPYVAKPYPADDVDFGETLPGSSVSTAFSEYNWELFFFAPLTIAEGLRQNLHFEEALTWCRRVYDPTLVGGNGFVCRALQQTPTESTDNWLQHVSAGEESALLQIAEWRDHPFDPHLIARMRLTSYQKRAVMTYLDIVIDWADHLFARDTLEEISHANLLLLHALEVLGLEEHTTLPVAHRQAPTFFEIREEVDALANPLVDFENLFRAPASSKLPGATATASALTITPPRYFCLPANDTLAAYGNTIRDRLFKIRNGMNMQGVVRQLPLFEPRIDPALLVLAASQGIDLTNALNEINAPLPHYRFQYMLQRAIDACADVRNLGGALLAALEKKDAEALAILRATQEPTLLKAMLEVRKAQERDAAGQAEALLRSREAPLERLRFQRWLMATEHTVPEIGAKIPLESYRAAPSAQSGGYLIAEEQLQLESSKEAQDTQQIVFGVEMLGSELSMIPNYTIGMGATTTFGGSNLAAYATALARAFSSTASDQSYNAAHADRIGGFKRRAQDYALQANIAANEIMQIDRQYTLAKIREDIAGLEREQLEQQIAHSEAVEEHLSSKFTRTDLYSWMQGQISALYFTAYQAALHLANQAEQCYRFERGISSSSYVRFDGWDSLRKGLLAGDTLHAQLKQLERAYQDDNRRDFELTKSYSLLQNAPMALLALKYTGRCDIDIPETVFDMDYPGHYMRRVKSISVSIPAVVGPYSSVNATVTLLASETRVSAALPNGKYAYDAPANNPPATDLRFRTDFTAVQSIATSSAMNDSGLFELNFHDERYLPFEGAGAASRWRIEIDQDCNRFDITSIADVVLQMKYTARDGGTPLRDAAKKHTADVLASADGAPQAVMFSMKHDFPSEWARLTALATPGVDRVQEIALDRSRFPFTPPDRQLTITRIDMLAVPKPDASPGSLPNLVAPDGTNVDTAAGLQIGRIVHRVAAEVNARVSDLPADALWSLSLPATVAMISGTDDLAFVVYVTKSQ